MKAKIKLKRVSCGKRKRITIADIAKLAGVSKTTASMVLNGRASTFRIKDETRKGSLFQYLESWSVYAERLIKRQVDGLVITSSHTNDAYYQNLSKQIPVLQLDRHIGQSSLPMVITDAAKVTANIKL